MGLCLTYQNYVAMTQQQVTANDSRAHMNMTAKTGTRVGAVSAAQPRARTRDIANALGHQRYMGVNANIGTLNRCWMYG